MSIRNALKVMGCIAIAGCSEECENGYKVKTEYKYVMGYEFWHENPKDDLLDGAIRVSTSSYKEGRALTIRCFKGSAQNHEPRLDIRYQIDAPLLKRVVAELEKNGPIEMVVSVDGKVIGTFSAKPISHDFGISFLGEVNSRLVDQIGAASKNVVVMPRQQFEKLDDMIEFGVAELVKHIEPVKKACGVEKADNPIAPLPEAK